MSDVIQIAIRSSWDGKGADQAARAIQQLSAAAKASGPAVAQVSKQAAAGVQQTGAAAAKSERQMLAYAQAQARLQQASGGAAQAEQTLSAALAKVNRSSIEAIRAQTQLVTVQNRLSDAKGPVTLPRTIDGLSGAARGAAVAFGVLGGAMAAIKGGAALAQAGAQADLVRQRFDSLAKTANTTGDALLNALRQTSGGEISDLNLQLSANKAQLLGVAHSAEEFGVLMSIARDRAQQMGISTTQAFDDLTTGLGRGSRLILDNLGIIVNADAANEKYATSIGKAVSALSDEERKQALINQVLADGRKTIEETGGAIESHAASLARAGAAWDNLRDRVGAAIAGQVAPAADSFADLVGGLDGTSEGIAGAVQGLGNLSSILSGVGVQTQATADINRDLGQSFLELIGFSSALEQQWTSGGGTTLQLAAATSQLSAEYNTLAPTIQLATANYQVQASTLIDQIAKTQQSAIEGRQLAGIQSTLAQLGPAVHGGLMTAVQAAQVLAAQYNITAAEALRLVNAQAQIAGMATLKGAALNLITGNRLGRGTAPVGGSAGGAVGGFGGGVGRTIKAAATAPRVRGGGGGGGGARVSEEQKTADKIADINERLADRLAEIDKRAGEERLAAQRSLADAIAQSSADLVAEQEADDLDLVRAKDDDAQKLINRERAQATARIANEQAVAEARASIAQGDAETTEEILKVKQDQIKQQQELDEHYLERQQELAGDDEAQRLLTEQYDQATKAFADAAAIDIEIAQAKAQQKAEAAAQEKADVIAAAEEEKSKIVGAASEQTAAVTSSLATQSSAASSWASSVNSAADRVVVASKRAGDAIRSIPSPPSGGGSGEGVVGPTGGKGGGKAEGVGRARGGSTNVGRATWVGEEGPELVVFDSPGHVYSAAQSRAMAAPHMQAGGPIVPAEAVRSLIETGILNAATTGGGKGGAAAAGGLKDALVAAKDAVDFLTAMASLRKELGQPQSPLDPVYVQSLADDTAVVNRIIGTQIVTISKDAAENAGRYFDSASGAIGILNDISDLRANLGEPTPPIGPAYVQALANDVALAGNIVGSQIVPLADSSVDNVKNYADSMSGAASILSDMASLRKDLGEPQPPIDPAYVQSLADDILVAGGILAKQIVPLSDKSVTNVGNYADSMSGVASTFKDMDDLRESLAEPQPPISPAYLQQLAGDITRAGTILARQVIPLSEEDVVRVERYADSVGAAVGVFKDATGLSAEMFTDYRSPSNAQIQVVAKDAKRVADAFMQAAKTYDTKGLEAGKLYADSVGGTFAAVKDGLLVIQALNSGTDFQLNRAALKQFEAGSAKIIDTTARLGKQAAAIPPGDIAALQSVTGAISAQAEALIRLTAVPFGNLGGVAGAFGQAGGGGAGGVTNTFNNTFVLPNGTTQQMAREIMGIVQQQMQVRR